MVVGEWSEEDGEGEGGAGEGDDGEGDSRNEGKDEGGGVVLAWWNAKPIEHCLIWTTVGLMSAFA